MPIFAVSLQKQLLTAKDAVEIKLESQFQELVRYIISENLILRTNAIKCLQKSLPNMSASMLNQFLRALSAPMLFPDFPEKRKDTYEVLKRFPLFLSQSLPSPNMEQLKEEFVKTVVQLLLDTTSEKHITDDVSLLLTIYVYLKEYHTKLFPDVQVIGEYLCTNTVLGSGAFGKVLLGRHRRTAKRVAIKKLPLENTSPLLRQKYKSEIDTMKVSSHPNIVKLYDYIETENHLYLIMEYCNGETLESYLLKNPKVREATAKHIISQLIKALEYLHKRNIFHRDLKPANIILTQDSYLDPSDQFHVKLIDFTFARILEPNTFAHTQCGTPHYMAPEIFHRNYDSKSDLWAVGIMLYLMLVGNLPSFPVTFPFPSPSDDAMSLINSLLQKNPDQRISLQELVLHPFLATSETELKNRIAELRERLNKSREEEQRLTSVLQELEKDRTSLEGKHSSLTLSKEEREKDLMGLGEICQQLVSLKL